MTAAEISAVILVYGVFGFVVWKTWPLIKELPSLLQGRFERWVARMRLEQEERTWLRAYAKAITDEERERLVVAQLRVHLYALGMDVSDLTDDQIEEGTIRFAELVAATGLTMEEAARNISARMVC